MALMTAAAGLYQYKGSDAAPATTPSWLPGGEGKYAGKAIAVLGGSSSVGQYGKYSFTFLLLYRDERRHASRVTRPFGAVQNIRCHALAYQCIKKSDTHCVWG